MNNITEQLLEMISDFGGQFKGAYNIREDGGCAARQSTENISLENMEDKPGLVIKVAPNTKNEKVFIPACVTKGGIDDLVYNDFYIGENADIEIQAGCGVHNEEDSDARHNGIHRFFLGKGAKVLYVEKHVGTGESGGKKRIDPVTEIFLDEDAVLEMNTTQIGGVDSTDRKTNAVLKDRAKLIIHENLLTEFDQVAKSDFNVLMNGEDSCVDLISRSVAKGTSHQDYHSKISGSTRCTGHSECDAILVGNGTVNAVPELFAGHIDASLIHEAAIGKIAGEQILKLKTLGLTDEEAEQKIIEGFLKA